MIIGEGWGHTMGASHRGDYQSLGWSHLSGWSSRNRVVTLFRYIRSIWIYLSLGPFRTNFRVILDIQDLSGPLENIMDLSGPFRTL